MDKLFVFITPEGDIGADVFEKLESDNSIDVVAELPLPVPDGQLITAKCNGYRGVFPGFIYRDNGNFRAMLSDNLGQEQMVSRFVIDLVN